MKKKKFFKVLVAAAVLSFCFVTTASAASSYVVASGDTLWKIASKNQVGVSELIAANPQLKNPDLIYPGETIQIPSVGTSVRSFETEVIRLVNAARAQNGLNPLKENWELSRVARYKSQDMHDKGYFSHTSPTYGSFSNMIKNFGIPFRTAGENIAQGYTTPQTVFNGWMNSTGHRANILNPAFTQIGVGYVADGHYWTQDFIG
jgi:uncharacterized YkwD family protein/spore coat assembly protein SafA